MPAPFADSTSELIRSFNDNNKGKISIEVDRGPLETESVSDLAISSLILGKSPYDIILMDVTWLPKYAEAGWIKPIDRLIDINKWDSLANGAKLGNSYKGKKYRVPLVADMGLLFWRTDLMKNPPTTPEELQEISQKLLDQKRVKYGYIWQGRQYEGLSCVFLEAISGYGGNWIDETDNIRLTTGPAIKSAQWLKELIETGSTPRSVTNYAENEALQAFMSGDAALMRNWPYAWTELQKNSSSVKGNVGVSQMVAIKEEYATSTLGSWGFSILSSSKNPRIAYDVISYLTSEDSQKYLFLNNGYTPTTERLYRDPSLLKQSSILPVLEKALNRSKPRPMSPLYAQISDVLQRQLSSILSGTSNVEEAMEIAQNNTEQILLSAGKRE